MACDFCVPASRIGSSDIYSRNCDCSRCIFVFLYYYYYCGMFIYVDEDFLGYTTCMFIHQNYGLCVLYQLLSDLMAQFYFGLLYSDFHQHFRRSQFVRFSIIAAVSISFSMKDSFVLMKIDSPSLSSIFKFHLQNSLPTISEGNDRSPEIIFTFLKHNF